MSSNLLTGTPTPEKSAQPPGGKVGEGEKDEYIIEAVSGLVAFYFL